MTISAQIGDRDYEFDSLDDFINARAIYELGKKGIHYNQNLFETELENANINFVYTDTLYPGFFD